MIILLQISRCSDYKYTLTQLTPVTLSSLRKVFFLFKIHNSVLFRWKACLFFAVFLFFFLFSFLLSLMHVFLICLISKYGIKGSILTFFLPFSSSLWVFWLLLFFRQWPLNSLFSCLSLPSSGVTDVCYHTCFEEQNC